MEKKKNYSLVQLKKVLKKAKLPTEGNREEVIKRIKANHLEISTPSDSEEIVYVPPSPSKTEIKWQWMDGTHWQDYDNETRDILEKAYSKKETQITLTHGYYGTVGGYTINFVKNTQIKKTSGYKRTIQRLEIELSEDEEAEDDIDENTNSVEDDEDEDNERWQWLDDNGWKDYDSETDDIISKAYEKGQMSVVLKHSMFGKAKKGYTIDFKQMLQTNNSSGYVRNIRKTSKSSKVSVSTIPSFPATTTPATLSTPMIPKWTGLTSVPLISTPITLSQVPLPPQMDDSSSKVTWEYQMDGNWKPFDDKLNTMIEGNFKRDTTLITINFGEWAKNPCNLNINEERMKEINSEKTYPVRRHPPIPHKKQKAPPPVHGKSKKHKKNPPPAPVEPPRTVPKDTEIICAKLTEWVKFQPKSQDSCVICFEDYSADSDPVSLKCTHHFCKPCIIGCYSQGFILCPMCKACYGTRVGNMPKGKLKIDFLGLNNCPLEGHEAYGTIRLAMTFPNGTQGPDHPNPGESYGGTNRTAYLPDTPEGREVLELLKVAWDRKLLFRIGTSVTTGAENQVIWNGIHLKTNTHGGATNFGYPDPTYFERVKNELKDKGIS